MQRKYPEATDASICSLIGGFFFLRFINPAIVTPQAYMLVDGAPAKHPRRTLTLVRLSTFVDCLLEYVMTGMRRDVTERMAINVGPGRR